MQLNIKALKSIPLPWTWQNASMATFVLRLWVYKWPYMHYLLTVFAYWVRSEFGTADILQYSLKGKVSRFMDFSSLAHLGVFQPCLWPPKAPCYIVEGCRASCQHSWLQYPIYCS